MSVPEARLLLRDLTEHATQREFVHVHKWTLHDLVMWDNRQTMHRVRRYDQSQPRDMRRATVAGTAADGGAAGGGVGHERISSYAGRPAYPSILIKAVFEAMDCRVSADSVIGLRRA